MDMEKKFPGLDERFLHYPDFLLVKPYCFATFSDPRYSWIYFHKDTPDSCHIKTQIVEIIKTEIEMMEEKSPAQNIASSTDNNEDSFWSDFDHQARSQSSQGMSIDAEIAMWSGVSRPHRQTNPIHAMEGLKQDHPRIYKLFCKYSIYPATQNKDERLFSMVARNTGPLSRSIKVETIERKVVVGSAVQKHGFIFDYTRASSLPDRDSSSDSADSF